ncbi:glycosyltransferase family 2 protein [Methylocapsa sp. D3K7]|uniref:glycosyltransferase family 2 protein n=1 Tax=Methylocapsa sp. D3K7 TaxID=3041435 RepID=UPI00244E8649|nr:glycosyltransferase family 2 protein [Methylocapsa sp. D3K7]WGJ15054.1 glycosyltransferase family 2 protein [Methylocapsa sp. D3K7]
MHGRMINPARRLESLPGNSSGEDKPFLRLPLVSVIVINFNYGRFLRATVESVLGQTYPNVECIVVDNASSDESGTVLQAIEARDAGVKIIRRAENCGQTPAALEGLAASKGPYVIFLDADDLLLPCCVETHVFVHLSLRIHVGFTSGDMLQMSGDQIVLGTEHAFNRILLTGRGIRPRAVRAYQHESGGAWPGEDFNRHVLDTIRFVGLTNQWVWAPTSGNCFRRDALCLFADNPALQNLKTGTDLYFCLGINAVSGSVLIDAPVAVYRLHGGNIYSQRPQLNHVLCYEPGGAGDSNANARAVLADQLIGRADRFVERGWIWIHYLWLLWRMDCKSPDPLLPPWKRRSCVAAALVKNYESVAPLLGTWPIKVWLALCLVPWKVISSLGKKPAS